MPLWVRGSGYEASALELLVQRCKSWYARRQQERRIKRGDCVAILGRGIAVVEQVNDTQVLVLEPHYSQYQAQGHPVGRAKHAMGGERIERSLHPMLFISPNDRVFVLTGLGVSAASGIPTFRGAGRLRCTHRIEDRLTAW